MDSVYNNTTHASIKCFLKEEFDHPSFLIKSTTLTVCILNFVCSISATLLNAFILILIISKQELRTNPHILIGFLAFTDFCTGTLSQPCLIIHQILALRGKPSCFMYRIAKGLIYCFCGLSLCTLNMVAFDRFVSVVWPFKYTEIATKPRLISLLMFTWLLWITVDGYFFMDTFNSIILNYVSFIATLFVVLQATIMYYFIFKEALRHRRQIQCVHNVNEIAPNSRENLQRVKNRKITFLIFFVFVLLLVCYIPITICLYIQAQVGFESRLNLGVFPWAEWLALANSSFNPLLYLLRSEEFRTAARSFCRRSVAPTTNLSISRDHSQRPSAQCEPLPLQFVGT